MARLFTRSKSLRKRATESGNKIQLWKTRLSCEPWNKAAVARATHRAEYGTGCNIEPSCNEGKLTAIAICPGSAPVEDAKDVFYRSLDRSRERGQVTMKGRR